MRPPRYRFPDQVRSTARSIAARMADEGSVAGTAEELDAWIAARPEARDALVDGGYGRDFDSADLLPLVSVLAAGASVQPAPAAHAGTPRRWWVGVLIAAVVAAVLFGILAVSVPR